MQLSVDEFWFMEPREFFNKLNGFSEFHMIKEEQEWKRTNYIAWQILINNPYIKKGDKPKTFEEFLKGSGTKKTINIQKFFEWKTKAEKQGNFNKENFNKFIKQHGR